MFDRFVEPILCIVFDLLFLPVTKLLQTFVILLFRVSFISMSLNLLVLFRSPKISICPN
jgi:hypothetical protein